MIFSQITVAKMFSGCGIQRHFVTVRPSHILTSKQRLLRVHPLHGQSIILEESFVCFNLEHRAIPPAVVNYFLHFCRAKQSFNCNPQINLKL